MAYLHEMNIEYAYNYYVDQWKRSEAYIKKMGGRTRGLEMNPYWKFRSDFITAYHENPKRGLKANAQRLAKDELYVMRPKQAERAARQYAKDEGIEYTPQLMIDFMMERPETAGKRWNDVRRRQAELEAEYRSQGIREPWGEIRRKIGHEYFGSPVEDDE